MSWSYRSSYITIHWAIASGPGPLYFPLGRKDLGTRLCSMAAKRLKKDDGMGEYFPTKLYNHLVGETGVFHSTERIVYVDVILGKN